MKPKRKSQPLGQFQGVGVVPLMRSEFLKRDLIHEHMVSHYRRLYNAKSFIDTSTPAYFKPAFKPRPRLPLPKPMLPVKTTLTKRDKARIEEYAGNQGPYWPPSDTDRYPVKTTEEFIESIMMSVVERPTDGKRKGAKVQHCRRIQSISVSPESRKSNNMTVTSSPLSRSVSKLHEIDFPASSRLREMSVYHPPRRRLQKKEIKEEGASYVYCSGCLAKINKKEQRGRSKEESLEKKVCVSHTVSKMVKAQREDLKYLQFIQNITQDILNHDAYTNECLEIIFQKHIRINEGELNILRMQEEIKKLKRQLDVPGEERYGHSESSPTNDMLPNVSNIVKKIDTFTGCSLKDNFSVEDNIQDIKVQNRTRRYRGGNPVSHSSKQPIVCGVSKVTAISKVGEGNAVNIIDEIHMINQVNELRKETENKEHSEQTEEKTGKSNDVKEKVKSEESSVMVFLKNMGFNLNMAQEICECMSDKDLMNFIPFDSEDKEWIEKLEDFEEFNLDALNEDISEPEDSKKHFEATQLPSALVGEGDAKLREEPNNNTSEPKKDEKKLVRNEASGDGPHDTLSSNTNPVRLDEAEVIAPLSHNTSETKESNPISGASVPPGVPSPVGSDYSSMKDHDDDDDEEEDEDDDDDDDDDSYKSSLAGEDADEGRESASEVDEDIPEDISVASSSSGVSQLAGKMKTISIRDLELKSNKSQNKINLPCSRTIET